MQESSFQIIRKIREIFRRLEREIFVQNNESCCSGVTLAQCHTLLEIDSRNKESVTELSKALGLDKSTISRTIDGLVNSGLVDRSIPSENRRMATLQLTDAGKQVCNSINCRNDQYFSEILSVLSDTEKDELVRLLGLVTSQMMNMRSSCKIGKE
ncbi:MAG TPA: MarR family transcriptional regulator [Bacteroidales bacterium]|nr:MarR family transcriptional regulator [Bacteroidales bacterium]